MSTPGDDGTSGAAPGPIQPGRRGYLDWLRGVAVLIMIEGHALDSWTREDDRSTALYQYAMLLGGMGAPLFLFLAGVAVVLAATSRSRRWGDRERAAASVRRRGWQVFGFAFLFRLQSFVLSPGTSLVSLLTVDILNIMGPGIVAAAAVWRSGRTARGSFVLLAGATAAVAMITPIVRASPLVAALPDPVEWYLRPSPGHTNFTLLPWSGFVLAGAAAGVCLERATGAAERPIVLRIGAVGLLLSLGGYTASFLPPIYAQTNFWTSSPTFFLLRTGLLLASVTLAWLWGARPWPGSSFRPLELLGIHSLFVYWIHVEMVYGVLTYPLHRRLSIEAALAGFAVFTLVMLGAVLMKRRLARWRQARDK
jgi:uncharacterized membrane protein